MIEELTHKLAQKEVINQTFAQPDFHLAHSIDGMTMQE
jgi:hypothetical protein